MKLPNYVTPLLDAVWKECRDSQTRYAENGETKYGVPPNELRIVQSKDADWKMGWCKEPYIHGWHYNDQGLKSVDEYSTPWTEQLPDGMYWKVGMIHFIVDEINRRCLYHYALGPRYSRGYKLMFDDVSSLSMNPDRDRMIWIS